MGQAGMALGMLIAFVFAAGIYLAADAGTETQGRTMRIVRGDLPDWESPTLQADGTWRCRSWERATGGSVLHCDAGWTEERMERALSGELGGMGKTFVRCGEEHDVDPVFLAAVCALESGWGAIDSGTNNIAGITRADPAGKTYADYDSRAQCVDALAGILGENYRKGGTWYAGSENAAGIAAHYCPGNRDQWCQRVTEIVWRMEKAINAGEAKTWTTGNG